MPAEEALGHLERCFHDHLVITVNYEDKGLILHFKAPLAFYPAFINLLYIYWTLSELDEVARSNLQKIYSDFILPMREVLVPLCNSICRNDLHPVQDIIYPYPLNINMYEVALLSILEAQWQLQQKMNENENFVVSEENQKEIETAFHLVRNLQQFLNISSIFHELW